MRRGVNNRVGLRRRRRRGPATRDREEVRKESVYRCAADASDAKQKVVDGGVRTYVSAYVCVRVRRRWQSAVAWAHDVGGSLYAGSTESGTGVASQRQLANKAAMTRSCTLVAGVWKLPWPQLLRYYSLPAGVYSRQAATFVTPDSMLSSLFARASRKVPCRFCIPLLLTVYVIAFRLEVVMMALAKPEIR